MLDIVDVKYFITCVARKIVNIITSDVKYRARACKGKPW